MPKTYLVTGAAGFIGAAVAARLIALGNNVYTIDNLSTGYRNCIPEGVHFVEGNCYDPAIIGQLEGVGIEVIYHIAGQSSGEVSYENPAYDLHTNTLSTLLLLDFAKRHKVKKFVYASTMSVYGDQDVLPVTEQAVPQPKSFYAVGKLASEQYLNIYHQLGVPSIALRLFNVFGPGQNLQNMKQGMASIFLAQALKEGAIKVKGSLDRFRDFVYIDDVVEAFLKAEIFDLQCFETFNISSGVKNTVGELVSLISRQFPQELTIEVLAGTPGDQFGIVGSSAKAEKFLQWLPAIGIEEGINTMYNWAKQSF